MKSLTKRSFGSESRNYIPVPESTIVFQGHKIKITGEMVVDVMRGEILDQRLCLSVCQPLVSDAWGRRPIEVGFFCRQLPKFFDRQIYTKIYKLKCYGQTWQLVISFAIHSRNI